MKKKNKTNLVLFLVAIIVIIIVWYILINKKNILNQNKTSIKWWDIVAVSYVIKTTNWDILYQTSKPISINVWNYSSIEQKIIWERLVWKKKWENFNIKIEPKDLWLDRRYNTQKIQKIPYKLFEKFSIEPKKWKIISLWSIKWYVKTINLTWADKYVILDTNPIYTYLTIKMNVKILDVINNDLDN